MKHRLAIPDNLIRIRNQILSPLGLLVLVLAVCSVCSVLIFGKNCTLEFRLNHPESAVAVYDAEILECLSSQVSGNKLMLEFRSVSPGDTLVEVSDASDPDTYCAVSLYVHRSGIITVGNYFGKCRGDILFTASVIIILLAILLKLTKKYRRSSRENLCRYINSGLLGAAIFIGFMMTEQLVILIRLRAGGENASVLEIMQHMLFSSNAFSMYLLPLAVLISLAISVSNLVLMKREGIRLRNMLGFFLGLTLCLGTIAPLTVYPLMERLGADVHRFGSTAMLISDCAEDITAMIMAYLECILIGTVISAVRAARHIPAFDKDYILILGCQIRKDGSLTKLLQSRADRAIAFAKMQKEAAGKEIVFVPSGGKGPDEVIAEAEAIRNYLVSAGIPETQILVENKSKNTNENIRFSCELIRQQNENARIAFSTTNYHVFRAGCIAEEAGNPMEGIGAGTRSYFWINAFIREFIAALHYEKKNHIRMLLWILCCLIPVELIVFFSYKI